MSPKRIDRRRITSRLWPAARRRETRRLQSLLPRLLRSSLNPPMTLDARPRRFKLDAAAKSMRLSCVRAALALAVCEPYLSAECGLGAGMACNEAGVVALAVALLSAGLAGCTTGRRHRRASPALLWLDQGALRESRSCAAGVHGLKRSPNLGNLPERTALDRRALVLNAAASLERGQRPCGHTETLFASGNCRPAVPSGPRR